MIFVLRYLNRYVSAAIYHASVTSRISVISFTIYVCSQNNSRHQVQLLSAAVFTEVISNIIKKKLFLKLPRKKSITKKRLNA